MMPSVTVRFITGDLEISDLGNNVWTNARQAIIDKYWNDESAPTGRHAAARLLWSDSFLYLRFDAQQSEPLFLNGDPQTDDKTMQLWEHDVCELFLAPDASEPRRYAEFEISPTGEWLDLMVDWRNEEPRDWEYRSGMEPFARIEVDLVTMAMRIPWSAFDYRPHAGDVWVGNLFRQVGSGETRGYLAWSPTMTTEPQFHVPEKFGQFIFQK